MNPSLDYLHQYPVKQVLAKKDENGYAIEFGGHGEGTGAIIGVENTSEIPELADKVLVTTIYQADSTRMIFGNVDRATKQVVDRVEVATDPAEYFIIDPRFGGEPHYPGRPVVEVAHTDTVRAQFEGRFADGPDEAPDAVEVPELENAETGLDESENG